MSKCFSQKAISLLATSGFKLEKLLNFHGFQNNFWANLKKKKTLMGNKLSDFVNTPDHFGKI